MRLERFIIWRLMQELERCETSNSSMMKKKQVVNALVVAVRNGCGRRLVACMEQQAVRLIKFYFLKHVWPSLMIEYRNETCRKRENILKAAMRITHSMALEEKRC
jgi:hypothetical protein